MFVGHYGPALAGKSVKKSVPLWVLFLAVQIFGLAMLGLQALVFFGPRRPGPMQPRSRR